MAKSKYGLASAQNAVYARKKAVDAQPASVAKRRQICKEEWAKIYTVVAIEDGPTSWQVVFT